MNAAQCSEYLLIDKAKLSDNQRWSVQMYTL